MCRIVKSSRKKKANQPQGPIVILVPGPASVDINLTPLSLAEAQSCSVCNSGLMLLRGLGVIMKAVH